MNPVFEIGHSNLLRVLLLVATLVGTFPGDIARGEDQDAIKARIDEVIADLNRGYSGHSRIAKHATQFTTNDLPVMAQYLTSSYWAPFLMMAIDKKESINLFCKWIPQATWNVDRDICGVFMKEADNDWFPREAARAGLLSSLETNRSKEYYNQIMALGVVGKKEDVTAIRTRERLGCWRGPERLGEATRRACARLGDEASLNEVIAIITPPSMGEVPAQDFERHYKELQSTLYIRHPRLVPSLIANLRLRKGSEGGDLIWSAPSRIAMNALRTIVPRDQQPRDGNSEDAWLVWWEDEQKKKGVGSK